MLRLNLDLVDLIYSIKPPWGHRQENTVTPGAGWTMAFFPSWQLVVFFNPEGKAHSWVPASMVRSATISEKSMDHPCLIGQEFFDHMVARSGDPGEVLTNAQYMPKHEEEPPKTEAPKRRGRKPKAEVQ